MGMNAASPEQQQLIGFVMLGTAATFAAAAGFLALRVRKRIEASAATQGTVVDSVARSGGDGGRSHSIVVEFTDESGETRRFTSRASAGGWDRLVGKPIDILYRRDDPSDARVRQWWVQWMQVTMVAGSAVIALLVGIVLLASLG